MISFVLFIVYIFFKQNSKLSSIVNKSAMSLDDTKVIYKDKNLVTVHARKMNKYVTAIMRILFTEEELKLGYIIEDKSTSKRTPLDLERVQLLKSILSQFTFAIYFKNKLDTIFVKYHVPEAKKGEVWIEMKSVANRLCMDLSKANNNNKENSENKLTSFIKSHLYLIYICV